jgi:hypothetical protein
VHFVSVAAATRRKWQAYFENHVPRACLVSCASRAGQCDSLCPAAGDNLGVRAETLSWLRNSGIAAFRITRNSNLYLEEEARAT